MDCGEVAKRGKWAGAEAIGFCRLQALGVVGFRLQDAGFRFSVFGGSVRFLQLGFGLGFVCVWAWRLVFSSFPRLPRLRR